MRSERVAFLARPRDWLDDVARRSPARLTLAVFAGVIAVVTGLLQLPIATAAGTRAPFVDSLFTATSAVSVTGLVTVDSATYWSTFGHGVIMVGIMVGGLGVMTLASILALAVSRHIGLTQRLLAQVETKTEALGEVGTLVRAVIIASLAITTSLSFAFIPRFLTLGFGLGESIWHGWFMAVSTFNNAGFVILPGGLAGHAGDAWMSLPILIGTFIGAIGFPVILTISSRLRDPRRWSLHAKLTITTSLLLWGIGAVGIAAFEWSNSRTLGPLSVGEKLIASLTAGMTPRSSGIDTVGVPDMSEASWFLQDALMFVGGGSASTAGGIKVTTLAVMVLAIIAEARGDTDIEAFGRRLDPSVVRLAIAVAFIGATMVGIATLALLLTTDLHLNVVLFEVISAFATSGLSTGITAGLPASAKYILLGLMFAGRVGTITLAAALALRHRRRIIRLPKERPIVG